MTKLGSDPPAPNSVKALAPRDWPIVDDGLLMAFVDRVLVVRIDERLTQRSFDRYRAEWTRSVDARPAYARVAALYDMPTWAGVTASQRKQWAEMLKSRDAILRRTTLAMSLVTPSPLARGALRAIFWLAPPPFPHDVVESREVAFTFLARHIPGLDGAACQRAYEELIQRHASARPS